MSGIASPPPAASPPPLRSGTDVVGLGPMLFPQAAIWLVFMGSMDVMLTQLVLGLGGREVNPIALAVIESWGWAGATAFKFATVLLALLATEAVGRRKPVVGRRLAWVLVALAGFPVVWSLILLWIQATTGPPPA